MTSTGFSPRQLQAITAGDGPLAIVAGPGCGKTTTLAARIASLVRERGLDPASILMVSFTTEAARRLRAEVARELGDRADDVSILTLHALGRRVIDTWGPSLGYPERPSVLHPDEANALLLSAADAVGWDVRSVPVGELSAEVDQCRLLVDPEKAATDPLAPLARAYEERLRRHGAIDFVAMLALPLRLFAEDQQALRVLQDAYVCVLADEVQDLAQAEWRLIELLAERHRNLLVAGDDRQCLFLWRGADPRALLHFSERHPEAPVVTLHKNYRSTGRLVQVANAVSELLGEAVPLWTDNPAGPVPRLTLVDDEHAEARLVAQQIESMLHRGLLPHPGEAAVLFRTRMQSDLVASALREAGLPYRLHGHADLFSTRAVRDCLAYLRLAANPADQFALMRVIDTPPRGLRSVGATLAEEPATLVDLPARAAEFGSDEMAAAAALVAVVCELHAQHSRGQHPVALLDRALDRSGLRLWLEHHPDGLRRLRMIARFRAVLQQLNVSLEEWLDALAAGDELLQPDEQTVRLCSVHASKGHEWRATWVIGVEEGLMPHRRAVVSSEADTRADALDEELRGFYVALTRARERLWLSACVQRTRGDRVESREPSRWLRALAPDLIAVG